MNELKINKDNYKGYTNLYLIQNGVFFLPTDTVIKKIVKFMLPGATLMLSSVILFDILQYQFLLWFLLISGACMTFGSVKFLYEHLDKLNKKN